ncbi:MAG: ceramidase domain-containing protein [Methyloligellaceae bacterium]
MAERQLVHACNSPGLDAWAQVDCYCERAGDPGFWAEPFNALSNVAFLIAAVMAWLYLRQRGMARGRGFVLCLILLVAVIGAGSFLFHTLATRWAAAADVLPIAVFIFAYAVLAYRRYVGASSLVAFGIALVVTTATFTMPPLFNGSLLYGPALFVLAGTAVLLSALRHPAGRLLWVATGVFAVSLTLRTVDRIPSLCEPFQIGTHFAWHLLNALTLYLLLRAAIENPPGEISRGRA